MRTRFDRQVQTAVTAVARPYEETIPIERLLDRLGSRMPHAKRSRVEASVRRQFHLTELGTAVYPRAPKPKTSFRFVFINSDSFEIPADDDRVWVLIPNGVDQQAFAESLLNQSLVRLTPIMATAGKPTTVSQQSESAFVIPAGVSASDVAHALLYAGQIRFEVAVS